MTEDEKKYLRKIDPESRPLFKAILELNQPIAYTCAEFERFIMQHYHKPQRIKPTYLYQWSGQSGTLKIISKWLFAAAIDYLVTKQVNPFSIIPPYKVAEHWARQKTACYTKEQAKQHFIERFQPALTDIDKINAAIDHIYLDYEQGLNYPK